MILKRDWKRLLPFLRIGFSLLLIAFLLRRFDLSAVYQHIKKTKWEFILFAFLLNLIGDFFSSLQWRCVLSIYRIRVSIKRLFSLYLAGAFFNNFLPTSVGGDVYKIHRLTRELKSNHTFTPVEVRTEGAPAGRGNLLLTGFTSVLMTRVMGLWSLLFIATLALLSPLNRSITGADISSVLVVLWGIVLLSFYMPGFLSRVKFLSQLHATLGHYRREKKRVLLAMVVSGIAQVLGIFFCMAVAASLDLNLTFSQIAYFSSLTIIISALPLAINGLGIREGSYVWLLNKVNIGGEAALSFSFLIAFLIGVRSIIGGILYAIGKDRI